MDAIELLNWARGPGLQWSLAICAFGILVRLIGIFALGRKADLSTPRGSAAGGGLRTLFHRSLPMRGMFAQSAMVLLSGYLFHLGFFIALLFFAPHISLFRAGLGLSWPALPTAAIDLATIIAIAALIASLIHRIVHPVRRLLTRPGDYLAWLLTFLPLATGYLAMHAELAPYNLMLALHIFSVEALLVLLPATKLIHAVTFGISRYYQGAMAGRKGVAA